eukprot:4249653-Prymnesium_polylepis.1
MAAASIASRRRSCRWLRAGRRSTARGGATSPHGSSRTAANRHAIKHSSTQALKHSSTQALKQSLWME